MKFGRVDSGARHNRVRKCRRAGESRSCDGANHPIQDVRLEPWQQERRQSGTGPHLDGPLTDFIKVERHPNAVVPGAEDAPSETGGVLVQLGGILGRDAGKCDAGGREDAAHQHIAHAERVLGLNARIFIAALLQQFDQPQIAFVLQLRRPLGRILDDFQIVPFKGGQVTRLNARQRGVPTRRIVGPAFPRVIDHQQSAAAGIPLRGQVAVPREHARVELLHASANLI